jgi:hypothetical protein
MTLKKMPNTNLCPQLRRNVRKKSSLFVTMVKASKMSFKSIIVGKGQNIENHNVESLKVDQKFEKDQNVESIFLN